MKSNKGSGIKGGGGGGYKSDNNVLVGYVPIEISSLCYHFRHEFPGNKIDAVITGKRHREEGLIVPAKYIFEAEDKRCAEIVERELMKRSLSNRQTSF